MTFSSRYKTVKYANNTIGTRNMSFFSKIIYLGVLLDIISFIQEMAPTAASVWDWSLPILPFTAIITFIVTLIACNLASNYYPRGEHLLQISYLGMGSTYVYFMVGIAMLLPQIVAIIIGRFQFLLKTQAIINQIILTIIHIVCLIPLVFILIAIIINRDNRYPTYLLSVYGICGCISLYCFLHTIIVFYLYIRRSDAPQHSKIIWPIWFLVCILLHIICFVVWYNTYSVISGYIAIAALFLYFLGFIQQFWLQAKTRQRYSAVTRVINNIG